MWKAWLDDWREGYKGDKETFKSDNMFTILIMVLIFMCIYMFDAPL